MTFGSRIKTIQTEDTAYFYADSKAVFLVEKSGDNFVVDETLDHLQDNLDPALFFRANRGFIVGIEAFEQMYSYSRSRIRIDLNPASPKECIVAPKEHPILKPGLGNKQEAGPGTRFFGQGKKSGFREKGQCCISLIP